MNIRLGDLKLDIQRKAIYHSLLELNGILLFCSNIIPQLPKLPQQSGTDIQQLAQIKAQEVTLFLFKFYSLNPFD